MNFFSKPTPEELARQELEVHKRNLLTHESDEVYHNKMAEYCRTRIATLESYLSSQNTVATPIVFTSPNVL